MFKMLLIGVLLTMMMASLNSLGQGLEKIIVEKYYVAEDHDTTAPGIHLAKNSVTYRVFVDMLPGYKFQAAYGSSTHELRFTTTTKFFNHADYGGIVPNEIPERNLGSYLLMLDSWISAGAAAEGNLGILKEEDNDSGTVVNTTGFLQSTNDAMGIPPRVRDGLIKGTIPKVIQFGIAKEVEMLDKKISGNEFKLTNGAWSCMEGSSGPTPGNRVLIAQLTTDGVFSFELNIQISKPGGGSEKYVAKNAIEEEILFEGLNFKSERTLVNSKKIKSK